MTSSLFKTNGNRAGWAWSLSATPDPRAFNTISSDGAPAKQYEKHHGEQNLTAK